MPREANTAYVRDYINAFKHLRIKILNKKIKIMLS